MDGRRPVSEELIEELALELRRAINWFIEADVLAADITDEERRDVIISAILPIIRRRELEAGQRVRDAAATVKPSNTPASECETTGQWTRRTLREAIRALDVAAIIGDSHD